jgi:WD40 repeat protein
MITRGLLLALPFLGACAGVAHSASAAPEGPRREPNLEPRSVAWSPDGEQLLHGAFDGCLRTTRARDGDVATLHRTRTPFIVEVRWSPDGGRLLAITDRTVELLDRQGSEVLVLVLDPPLGDLAHPRYGPGFVSGEFSPDGARLVLGGWADGRVEIREARTGAIEHVFAHVPGRISSVSWSPDGRRLAVGAWDRSVRILDVDSREEVARFVVKPAGWVRVSYSPDGKRLAWHGFESSTWLREIETGAEREIAKREGTRAVAWSPDARRIAVVGWSSLDVWDVDSMERVRTIALRQCADEVVWSPDGQYIAVSCFLDQTVVWNVRSGASIEASGYPSAFSPDMRFVAFGARIERFSRF